MAAYEITCHDRKIDSCYPAEICLEHIHRYKGNVESIGYAVAESAKDEDAHSEKGRKYVLLRLLCMDGFIYYQPAEYCKHPAFPPSRHQPLIDHRYSLFLYFQWRDPCK